MNTRVRELESNSESKRARNKGYHKLILWQKAREFLKLVYKYSDKFPKSEEYVLKSQLRRAVLSVVLNIVEGYRRSSTKEFIRFLNISGASLTEVEACLEIALDLGYFTEKEYIELEENRVEIEIILFSFEKSLRKKL